MAQRSMRQLCHRQSVTQPSQQCRSRACEGAVHDGHGEAATHVGECGRERKVQRVELRARLVQLTHSIAAGTQGCQPRRKNALCLLQPRLHLSRARRGLTLRCSRRRRRGRESCLGNQRRGQRFRVGRCVAVLLTHDVEGHAACGQVTLEGRTLGTAYQQAPAEYRLATRPSFSQGTLTHSSSWCHGPTGQQLLDEQRLRVQPPRQPKSKPEDTLALVEVESAFKRNAGLVSVAATRRS